MPAECGDRCLKRKQFHQLEHRQSRAAHSERATGPRCVPLLQFLPVGKDC